MTWGELAFRRMFNGTGDIVRFGSTPDAAGGPVVAPTTAYSGVECCIQDRYPRLHGDQQIVWDQPVILQAHFVFVLGIYSDLGSGNGYGFVTRGTTWRLTNVWRFEAPPGFNRSAPSYAILVCEEVSS